MKPSVLIAEPERFSAPALALLSRHADVSCVAVDGGAELADAMLNHDAVWIRLAHKITAQTLARKPLRCQVLACNATGIDHIDEAACAAHNIRIVSLRGETAFLRSVTATAELAVGLALALVRKIPQAHRDVTQGRWRRDAFCGTELSGKTVGIVGVGRLGSMVARTMKALGCSVIGTDPRADFPSAVVDERVTFDALLDRSDLVSIHVNYNDNTHHLMSADAFARMKPGAFFINTARGGLVDEVALLRHLDSGHLAGAALDVLEGEPDIDGNSPVVVAARDRDNLLITPHLGGNTVESFAKTELFLAGKLLTALGVAT